MSGFNRCHWRPSTMIWTKKKQYYNVYIPTELLMADQPHSIIILQRHSIFLRFFFFSTSFICLFKWNENFLFLHVPYLFALCGSYSLVFKPLLSIIIRGMILSSHHNNICLTCCYSIWLKFDFPLNAYKIVCCNGILFCIFNLEGLFLKKPNFNIPKENVP